ncbi:unnamed protein product [Caenorhabditis angaria]|uniref:N-alpha-acetyltransferase 60 n=1 Tax=Caenorhabditis angaria TaxID=860376 RepID=A0A9P1I6H5_9PELO|nr:unnamed protein product [Caenorhabditis angaria]
MTNRMYLSNQISSNSPSKFDLLSSSASASSNLESEKSCSTILTFPSTSSASNSSSSFVLRQLRFCDRPAVEQICNESFPIQYPECWYDEVVSGSLTSTGLFDGPILAAIIVSETKTIFECNSEDQDILSEPINNSVVYILSLAVAKPYRRQGLATRLLDNLFNTIVMAPPYPRAVFLHVLSTNSPALSFYKMHGFQWHASLVNYYRIGDEYGDGCTYVKYTNGSRPPITFYEILKMFGTTICMPIKAVCKFLSF